MIKRKKIVIATGGTGGHVLPAYSLASHLSKNNYNVNIIIDEKGLKYLKDYKNLDLTKIPSSPLIKKKHLKNPNFNIYNLNFNIKIFNFFII